MTRSQQKEIAKRNDAAVAELRSKGFKLKQIEEKLNLTPQQVRYYLYKKGIKLTPKPIPTVAKPILDRIIVLTNFGYNISDIALEVDMKKSKVQELVLHLKSTNRITKRV